MVEIKKEIKPVAIEDTYCRYILANTFSDPSNGIADGWKCLDAVFSDYGVSLTLNASYLSERGVMLSNEDIAMLLFALNDYVHNHHGQIPGVTPEPESVDTAVVPVVKKEETYPKNFFLEMESTPVIEEKGGTRSLNIRKMMQ